MGVAAQTCAPSSAKARRIHFTIGRPLNGGCIVRVKELDIFGFLGVVSRIIVVEDPSMVVQASTPPSILALAAHTLTLGATTAVQDKRTTAQSDGTDSLKNVERLKFSDVSLALDLDGHAGQAAKLLGAVFGAASVANKQFVGVALSLLDGGMGYKQLVSAALGVTGKTSNAEVASLLWTNLFGAAPTTDQVAPIVAILDSGMSQGALTVLVADTSFNTEKINLVGLSQTGIEFM
jgi:hypothetical protein